MKRHNGMFDSERAAAAGVRSGEVRRKKRSIREAFTMMLDEVMDDGRTRREHFIELCQQDEEKKHAGYDSLVKMQQISGEKVDKSEVKVATDDDLADRIAAIFNKK